MAATDRQNPNFDDFVGLNWSCWVEKVNVLPSDDNSQYGRKHPETMVLNKQDMHIYGYCPAHDEICLVVCSLCGHLIKAQAFEKHWDRWHDPLNMKCCQLSGLAHQQGPCPGPPLLHCLSSSKETVTKARYPEASFSHTNLPAHQQSLKETRKDNARYEEIIRKMMMVASAGRSTSRTYSRIHRNTGKKKNDAIRLFKVNDPEKKRKACSLEPISNPFLGRMKVTDHSASQKMASKEQNMKQHLFKLKVRGRYLEESVAGGSKHNGHYHNSRPMDPPHSCPENMEVELQSPDLFNQRLLSGEEGEEDNEQEVPGLSWHPKPLGLCTFGCRTLGCNIFTFDRRWQHLRLALSAMLEHYVGTRV